MTSYAKATEQFGTRLIDSTKPVQDVVAQAVEIVDGWVAKLPTLPVLPGVDRLPSRGEVLTANFDLAQRLLTEQREFALRLVKASSQSGGVFVPSQAKATEDASASEGAATSVRI